jgi:hypothetical protein
MSREFWIVLIVCVALTLLLFAAFYPYTYPYTSGGRQRYNMAVSEEKLPRVNAILAADNRFQHVQAYVYTGQEGAVGLTGTVENDDDLCRLMKAVAAERLPVAVSWQVDVVARVDEK